VSLISEVSVHVLSQSSDYSVVTLFGFDCVDAATWPAPGSADTELSVLMEPEVCHGETEVYPGSSSLRRCG